MRVLPAGWPAPGARKREAAKVYLHVIDVAWPPASTQKGEDLPAGWSLVSSWSIDAQLDAALLPGQVNASPSFTIASGGCSIPQPKGGLSAPWRVGGERTPSACKVELVASYDGHDGSTAFVLGQFLLDPIKGRVSSHELSLTFVQDLVRLRRPHTLPPRIPGGFGGGGGPGSPTRLLEAAATASGYTLNATADFESTVTASYFPGKTDQLTAMQSIVAANLGALFLSMDGTTIEVKDPDYLLGAGTPVDTIDVSSTFDDLAWSQDPNAAPDRIEVTFLPPSFDDAPMEAFPFAGAVVWSAPKGARIAAAASVTYDFDPGTDIVVGPVGGISTVVYGNSQKDGTGTNVLMSAAVTRRSSGSYSVTITNDSSSTRYLMAPYFPPSGGVGTTDYTRNTRSFLTGTINGVDPTNGSKTLVWGVPAEDATNTLTVDLGRNIELEADARAILDRIVTRVSTPTYVVEDVNVVPDVRRELADLYRLSLPAAGFNSRAMVTGIKTSGNADGMEQTLTIAAMPLRISDFNAAWDAALPGATIADFDAVWAGKTIDALNADPLRTTP